MATDEPWRKYLEPSAASWAPGDSAALLLELRGPTAALLRTLARVPWGMDASDLAIILLGAALRTGVGPAAAALLARGGYRVEPVAVEGAGAPLRVGLPEAVAAPLRETAAGLGISEQALAEGAVWAAVLTGLQAALWAGVEAVDTARGRRREPGAPELRPGKGEGDG